jgi:hypothetical protein
MAPPPPHHPPCAGVLFVQHGSLYAQLDGGGEATSAPVCVIDRRALAGGAAPATAAGGDGGAPPPIQDVSLCERSGWVAFECGDEVYVAQAAARMTPAGVASPWPAHQITSGARGVVGLHHGSADYLSAEEFSRMEGLWWSPDGACAGAAAHTPRQPPHLVWHAQVRGWRTSARMSGPWS